MFDIKLTKETYDIRKNEDEKDKEWDIEISSTGDILLTESIVQAVKVRLKWIMNEWRLGPELGFPYFEEVFIKKPNIEGLRQRVKKEILQVEGVENAEVTDVTYKREQRKLILKYYIVVNNEKIYEEDVVNG